MYLPELCLLLLQIAAVTSEFPGNFPHNHDNESNLGIPHPVISTRMNDAGFHVERKLPDFDQNSSLLRDSQPETFLTHKTFTCRLHKPCV